MAKLESLIVDLQMNTAALQKGLDEANAKLGGFDAHLKELAGVVVFERFAEMAGQAIGSLVGFAMKGAEAADAMGKLAQASGMSVESFSRMAYAGDLSGIAAEALSASMVKLDRALVAAAHGGQKQAALFASLGVQVTDASGKVRAADSVMGDLAERFSAMADGATKTALATELFGETGGKLIPLLNAGRDGMAELGAEADRLGITISGSAAAAAEAFNDNITKLERSFQAIGQRAAAELTPALTKLTDELLNSKTGSDVLKGASAALATALRLLASGGVIIGAVFEAVGKTLARVASAVANLVAGRFSAAWEDLKGQFTDIGDASTDAMKRLETIWEDSADAAETAAKRHKKAAEDVVAAFKKVKAARDHAGTSPGHSGEASRGDEPAGHSAETARDYGMARQAESSHQNAAPVLDLSDDIGGEVSDWFEGMGPMLASAGTQMLGGVGDLVNSIAQGAEAGGVWGALIAAIMEVAKKTASALAFLDSAMQFIEKIAVMVEPLVEPIFAALQGVLEIVVDVVAPVFAALQPFFNAISALIEDLSPILWAIGDLFASLAPIIEFIGMLVGDIFEALGPVFDLIAGVIKVIATVIMGILIGLNELAAAFGDKKAAEAAKRMKENLARMWDGKERESSTNLDPRSTPADGEGAEPVGGGTTKDGTWFASEFDAIWARNEQRALDIEAARYSAFADAINAGSSYADAEAAGEAAKQAWIDANPLEPVEWAAASLEEAADEAAASLATFSRSLTNVPEGFRYAAAAFNATGELPGATVFGGGGGGDTINVTVQGSVWSAEDLAKVIENQRRRSGFRQDGGGMASLTENLR